MSKARREEKRGEERQYLLGDPYDEGRAEGVQQNVDEVIAERLEAAQQVIQPVSGNAERSIAAVGAALPQRRAPKVILQQPRPGRAWLQVRVRQYRSPATARSIPRSRPLISWPSTFASLIFFPPASCPK